MVFLIASSKMLTFAPCATQHVRTFSLIEIGLLRVVRDMKRVSCRVRAARELRQNIADNFHDAFRKQQSRCRSRGTRMKLKGYTTGAFDRGAPKWREALWVATKCVFFLNPWPWPSALRVALLRAFGARIGAGVVIRSRVNITFPWRLCVGDDVWFGEEVLILSLAPVTIESNVCLSQRAFVCTGSHDFLAPGFDLVTKPVTIREGSWIAAQAFIAPGVEVGEGSMVSVGSCVLENVPPRSLVRGNPAVVVREFGSVQGAGE